MRPIRPDYLAFGRPNFSDEEIDAVTRVMRSGWIGMGAETIAFERELAEFVDAPHVVTVNSCTSALFLSLAALGVGPGDEVICPSLTWCSTANAALYLGATPVLCDVDRDTLSVTPETILDAVSERTKAVMVVHMGGLAADIAAIRDALPGRISIVEDAAHAFGATYPDATRVGSSPHLTCFSFYANKNLATGEGGAISVQDPATAEMLRSLRQHGLSTDAWRRFIDPASTFVPSIQRLGYKMNYIDLLAAIGRVQLARQTEFARIRLALACRYRDALAGFGFDLQFQRGSFISQHARHLLLVKLPIERLSATRNEIVMALRERNIGASVHYPPLHRLPLYAPFKRTVENTERIADCIMTLPISAAMSVDDVDYVAEHLIDVFRSN